ncbi:MAG: glycosyltransferase [Prochlorococcaceae cyanobacterium]
MSHGQNLSPGGIGHQRPQHGLSEHGGRWGLRLLGCGPLQNEIAAQIASLPEPRRVRLEPFQQLEALQRSYGQASAFVLASHSDQWGLVVNEAMAAGLPVLVSDACGCAIDLVEHGVSGWCFDPAQPEQLTVLLHTAERQRPAERKAMVETARQRLEAFSPESFAAGLAAAVGQALARGRRSHLAALTAGLLGSF